MAEGGQRTRREFLADTGRTAAGAGLGFCLPAIILGKALGQGETPPASERVRLGFVGTGGQGKGNLHAMVKNAVAVCDVDSKRLAEAKEIVEKANGGTCAAYSDYRRLLDDKNIDAIVVSTPDHWHALVTTDACAAGKDVYCEKPLTLTIAEGQAMVRATRRYNRIVQTGSQQRSDTKFRTGCELVRSGRIGKVKRVLVGIAGVNFVGPAVPDTPPPPELDYDFWLGPAPKRPYNPKHVHYNFRFYWDYSGGQLTNWGAHHLDIAQWGLGTDDSGPVSIEGKARYNKDGWYEVPEWFDLTYEYADGTIIKCGMDYPGGTTFEGEKGTLHLNRGVLQSDPADIATQPLTDQDVHLYASRNHHQNWLECIKSRKPPICDVAIGHRSASVCHLGNIAIRTGRKIRWDPAKERIVDDSDAQRMVSRPYRSPWRIKA